MKAFLALAVYYLAPVKKSAEQLKSFYGTAEFSN